MRGDRMKEPTPEKFIDPDELTTEELLQVYKRTADERYKWPLVMRYEGLVKSAALQIRGVYSHFAQVDDIVNEGILTLLSAIDKFDPEKGIKFETYVSKRIRGMVIDLARKNDWLPRGLRKRSAQIDQAIGDLYVELGRYPTEAEVADRLGITTARYQKDVAGLAVGNVLSLDALMDMRDEEGSRFELSAADPSEQPDEALTSQEFRRILAEGIRTLRQNEQIVLSLYYEKNLHMKDIAQVLAVSEPRISQIHSRAIRKLHDYMQAYISGEEARPGNKGKKG